jgi:hypothetical protein
MAAPTQPVQIGTAYAVNFASAHVPTTAGYMAKDGWKRTNMYAKKSKVEDYAGNTVNRTGAGKAVMLSGTLFCIAGSTPEGLKPGDSFSMTPVVAGEVTGVAVIYSIVTVSKAGNREHDELNLTVIKEDSMTYTIA